jgi:hypothetical protein
VVKYLHEHGVDINAMLMAGEFSGSIPVGVAVINNHVEMVYYFLKYIDIKHLHILHNYLTSKQPLSFIKYLIKYMIEWRMQMYKAINFCSDAIANLDMLQQLHPNKAQLRKIRDDMYNKKRILEEKFDNYVYQLIKDGAIAGDKQCQQILLLGYDWMPFRSRIIEEK